MSDWEKYLKDIYSNPTKPASFSGPDKLYRFVKKDGKYDISKYKIRKWLQRQEPYSLHKPARRRFHRNHVISAGIDDLWMCDLIDMVKFHKWNKDFKYILLAIDVFSKFVWLRPLKNKTGTSVAEAFKDIFDKSRKTPRRLVSDKGQEFRALMVRELMDKLNILYSPTQNETKASVSERAILTIKNRLYRYFAYKENYEYLSVLQNIAESYNNTFHRTIGTAPTDVNISNAEEVRLATYFSRMKADKKYPSTKRKHFKFKVGDYVRISHLRNMFTRAYDETYTGELFRVSKRYFRGTIPVYRLKDMNEEDIKGTFYQSELQKVDYDPNQLWKLERILKSRGRGDNKQYLVKWKHYPSKFNSWIRASDVI